MKSSQQMGSAYLWVRLLVGYSMVLKTVPWPWACCFFCMPASLGATCHSTQAPLRSVCLDNRGCWLGQVPMLGT